MPRIPKSDEYEVYRAETIQETQSLQLTRSGLILVALMSGGDYSKGLMGCGPATSFALAKCGFGDSLIYAFDTFVGPTLNQFLDQWFFEIKEELRLNSHGFMSSRNAMLADRLSPSFIQSEIINLYLHPVTSLKTDSDVKSAWISREPSIHNIASFCFQKFGWRTQSLLVEKLKNPLWEGVFLRMITSVSPSVPWALIHRNNAH